MPVDGRHRLSLEIDFIRVHEQFSILEVGRERESTRTLRGERKRKIIRSIFFPFYYEDCEKGFSRITFLVFGSGKRAIYGGEMKETGESLDLEQRSGETLADARHGSR